MTTLPYSTAPSSDLQRPHQAIFEAVIDGSEQLSLRGSWHQRIDGILERLGQAALAERAYLIESRVIQQNDQWTTPPFEWVRAGITSRDRDAQSRHFLHQTSVFERWITALSQGGVIGGHVKAFPKHEQDVLFPLGISSVILIPVFTGPHWWGMIGIEGWQLPHEWPEAELGVLQSLGTILGHAIQRNLDIQKHAHTFIQLRDQSRDRASELARANHRLEQVGAERRQIRQAIQLNDDYVQLLQDVAVASNEATDADDALRITLDRVCAQTGWPVGHVYKVTGDPKALLRPTQLWHIDHPNRFETFRAVSEVTSFRTGVGLPGRVASSGQPAWIRDVTLDPNFPRAKLARDLGVRAGFAFPVMVGKKIAAVLEFFSSQAVEPDARLLEVMAHVGTQLGWVIERTEAETTLRRSEQRYRSLFNHASVGIAHVAFNGRILRANPALCKILDYTPDELVGLNVNDVTHPDDVDVTLDNEQRLLSGDTGSLMFQKRCLRKDGSEIWINLRKAVVDPEVSEPKYFVFVIEDITDRKCAEEALRDSEARFRHIFDHSNDAIFLIDPTCDRIVDANDTACKMLGYSRKRLLSMPVSAIHPDDRSIIKAISKRVLAQGTGQIEEILYWTRAGCSIPCEVSASMIDIAGRSCMLALVRNITERKRAEAKSQLRERALESAINGILITDARQPDNPVVYVNPAFERITGYRKDQTIGQHFRTLYTDDEQEPGVAQLRIAIAQKREMHVVLQSHRRDGASYWSEMFVSPIRSNEGDVTHFVVIQNDITKRIHAQEQIQQHQIELAHVARLSTVGELASGLAHEINQPLAAISNYVQVCAEQIRSGSWNNDALVDTLHKTSAQCHRAAQIIRRVRDFISKKEPNRSLVDINELIRDVIPLLEPDARSRQVTIRFDLYNEPLSVEVDGVQIEQVIVNLARNGLESMDNLDTDDRQLTIRTFPAGKNAISVSIQDTGIGLSDKVLDKAFEPFFTTKPLGMGMGLSISRSIIESHGGRLTATNPVERGSIFQFTLPRCRVQSEG